MIRTTPLRAEPRPGWAAALLEVDDDWRALARRVAIGAALSAIYGVALGAREGGLALALHAVGVPSALLAVCALGLPALYIVLALFDAPLAPITKSANATCATPAISRVALSLRASARRSVAIKWRRPRSPPTASPRPPANAAPRGVSLPTT